VDELMREHAVTAALTVSFQRYPYPPSGWVEALPRSRGALPLAAPGPGRLLLPVPDGEAFWVGLLATPQGPPSLVAVAASLASGERVDLATGAAPAPDPGRDGFAVPPRFAVEGIARGGGGWWALAREAPAPPAPACAGLELLVWTGPAAATGPRERGPRPQHDPTGPAGPRPPRPAAEAPAGPPVTLRVELVDPARFEAAGGARLPEPAGDEGTYRGWPLP
jgi:hypothetical protein